MIKDYLSVTTSPAVSSRADTCYNSIHNVSGGGGASFSKKGLLWGTIVFTYTLMVIGNIVTSTGSGLACPDWPLCYGSVNPPKEVAIWIEWGHRLLGAVTGILILLSTIYSWKHAGPVLRFFLKVATVCVIAGILLGGLVVLIEAPLLEGFIHISVVSSHIIISTIIFTSMIFVLRGSVGFDTMQDKSYAIWLFFLVYFQVILGIFVRYTDASLSCPDFPLCHGSFLPPNFDPDVLLHYAHRLIAIAIFTFTLWKLIKAAGNNFGKSNFKRAAITFLLVVTQAVLGASIVITQMFLPVVILHGAVGFMLLGWTAYESAPYFISSMSTQNKAVI